MSWLSRLLSRRSDTNEARYKVTYEQECTDEWERRRLTLEGGIEKELWVDRSNHSHTYGDYWTEPWGGGDYVYVDSSRIMMTVEEVELETRTHWESRSKTLDDAEKAIQKYNRYKNHDSRQNVEIEVIGDE